jgi:hypothetical protein
MSSRWPAQVSEPNLCLTHSVSIFGYLGDNSVSKFENLADAY